MSFTSRLPDEYRGWQRRLRDQLNPVGSAPLDNQLLPRRIVNDRRWVGISARFIGRQWPPLSALRSPARQQSASCRRQAPIRNCRAIEEHVALSPNRIMRCVIHVRRSDAPAQGLLSRNQARSPGAAGKWAIELEMSGGISKQENG